MFVDNIRKAMTVKRNELMGRRVDTSSKEIFLKLVEYFENMENKNGEKMNAYHAALYDTLTDQVRLALSVETSHVALYQNRMVSYFEIRVCEVKYVI